MDFAEREIYHFLKHAKGDFATTREVSRRAGSKRLFQWNPEWAKPVLERMVERSILERNEGGRFRLKPPGNTERMQRWVSPEIAKLLSARKMDQVVMTTADLDDYYYQL